MYTFCQECETKKTSPILKKKILHLPPLPQKKKKTLYTNEDELLLTVKLKLSSLWKRSMINESLDNFYLYEQFSAECCKTKAKTKTKPIKTTNHIYQSEQRLTSSLTDEN